MCVGVNLGKEKRCMTFCNFCRKWQNRILKWEKNCFILSTFEFLLVVCSFSSWSGFIKNDHKMMVTGYRSNRQVCGITTFREKTPIIEEGTFEQCREFFQKPIREKFPFQAYIFDLYKIQNPQEISPIRTGVHRIPIHWKICLSWALTSYADFCGLHTNKEKNRNGDTDLGQEREEGDRWLDGLTLRSFQTSKLKTLRYHGANHPMRSRHQHAVQKQKIREENISLVPCVDNVHHIGNVVMGMA